MPGPDSPFTPPEWMMKQEQEQERLPEEDRISELNSQLERLESGISEQPANTGRAEKIKKLYDQYRAMKGKQSEDIEALKDQRSDAELQQTLTSAAEKIAEGIATKGAAQKVDIDMEDMKSRPMEQYRQKLKDLEQQYASKGEELDSRFKEQEMVGQARSEEEQARLNKMKNIMSLKKAGVDLRSAMRQEEDEEALNDPGSPVTKMYRTLAKESHLAPLFKGINPDEYTAGELKNMYEQVKGIAQETGKVNYSMEEIQDPESGETVLAAVNEADPSDVRIIGKVAKDKKDEGPSLTKGQEQLDKSFAKEYSDFVAGGGYSAVKKNLDDIKNVVKELEKPGDITGTVREKLIPSDYFRSVVNPEAQDIKDRVEQVVQQSLRETLGAQFTEKEAERLIERAYNPKLSDEQNIRRLKTTIEQIDRMARSKQEAADYFEKKGTLKGFKGTRLMQDKVQLSIPDEVKEKLGVKTNKIAIDPTKLDQFMKKYPSSQVIE